MPTPVHHMAQKVMLHLNCASCLNLRNVVVPLMMLLAAYGTDAGANGMDYHKVVLHLISVVLT